jgi:ABC-type transport system involved in cytochrome bd biosynthesis fused ATPase/permease subunit
MKTDNFLLGGGMALLGLVMTFGMPVNARRVNQGLVSGIIIIAFGVAALALFEIPAAFLVMAGAIIIALVYRDVIRFVKHALYDVTKYRRRDWWYRRVGQTILGGSRRKR